MNACLIPSSISAYTLEGEAGGMQQATCLSKLGGGFTPVLLSMDAVAKWKLVAAAESIFHKLIILQAFPEKDPRDRRAVGPAHHQRLAGCDTLYPLWLPPLCLI